MKFHVQFAIEPSPWTLLIEAEGEGKERKNRDAETVRIVFRSLWSGGREIRSIGAQ